MDHHEPPLTPMDRYFVQPRLNVSITLSVTFENPIDIQTLKDKVKDHIINRKLPNPFFSLLVRDSRGRERWRETLVDVDRHFVVVKSSADAETNQEEDKEEDDSVNDYVSYISSSRPLSRDKPLWEIHVLEAQRTAVFHGSHAIGDGISMMTLLTSFCRRVDDGERISPPNKVSARRKKFSMLTRVRYVRNSLLFVSGLSLRGICGVGDDTAAYARGGGGAELVGEHRKLATARFQMRDMEIVKGAVPGATINDVLFGVISCGLSRYLSQNAKKESSRISCTMPVNLRQYLANKVPRDEGNLGIRWGNIVGMYTMPIVGYCDNPVEYVKRAKHMLDQRKLSIEATFSNKIASILISLFGTKVGSFFVYRTFRTSTFTTSNLIGPKDKVAIASNPVKSITLTSNSQPHAVVSVVMHMVSYAGVGYMQISVVEEIIEDPKSLAKCLEDVLLEMKQMC